MWCLHNTIQRYAWGSHEAMARLQGRPGPTAEPEAELWMGAHAKAPSRLVEPRVRARSLLDAIEAEPVAMLGAAVHARFGPRLPFLLKVLAAAEPLSLQAHPDAAQAERGFAREEAAGIDRAAPHRSYRDPHAKPELVCALGPFVALCGFRAVDQTRALVEALGVPELRRRAEPLGSQPGGEGLAAVVSDLLTDPDPRPLVDAVVEAAAKPGDAWARERAWVVKLGEHYPGDPGVVVAMLLNLIELSSGEALYLSAGQLHCYLHGTAVEIMGGSDNVLRGGLTPKHVDVPELLAVLDRHAGPVPVLRPEPVSAMEATYETPAPVFGLSRLELPAHARWLGTPRGPEVVLAIEGVAHLYGPAEEVMLEPGASAFVPGSTPRYEIHAPSGARLFRATVGL